jgi:hypothetical protein
MATAQIDLWPPSFEAVSEPNPPIDILREQAALLEQKTGGVVLAEVLSGYDSNFIVVHRGKTSLPISHSFYLVAPALENYRYQLFRIDQPIEHYPLFIIGSPIGDLEVESQEEFVETLRRIFSDDKTQKVIQSLIAHSSS